mmetsp:Transcript_23945/g.35385  ORF Transcript_23945/g.35385 Transcript_23945/m.35385 type:complete len:102 (-) Transcript_23945:9-314(-)
MKVRDIIPAPIPATASFHVGCLTVMARWGSILVIVSFTVVDDSGDTNEGTADSLEVSTIFEPPLFVISVLDACLVFASYTNNSLGIDRQKVKHNHRQASQL